MPSLKFAMTAAVLAAIRSRDRSLGASVPPGTHLAPVGLGDSVIFGRQVRESHPFFGKYVGMFTLCHCPEVCPEFTCASNGLAPIESALLARCFKSAPLRWFLNVARSLLVVRG